MDVSEFSIMKVKTIDPLICAIQDAIRKWGETGVLPNGQYWKVEKNE